MGQLAAQANLDPPADQVKRQAAQAKVAQRPLYRFKLDPPTPKKLSASKCTGLRPILTDPLRPTLESPFSVAT